MTLLGSRIKQLRIEKNLTQSELGKLINVTKVRICCYEKGSRLPSLETLIDLSEVFGVSVDYLIGNDVMIVSDNSSNYNIGMSKEKIIFMKEIRKYSDLYKKIINNPKRIVELINKKLK